jgi:hypothetical protein
MEELGNNARMTRDPNFRTRIHAKRRQRLSMRRKAKNRATRRRALNHSCVTTTISAAEAVSMRNLQNKAVNCTWRGNASAPSRS